MKESIKDTQVTVSGATGFIASHCILQLLQAGYRVHGTLRNAKRGQQIKEALQQKVETEGRLQLFEADLMQDKGWAQAITGSKYVLHIASPLPSAPPKDEMDLIRPAKEGAIRVLRAAAEAGVERVVMTSSISAVASGHLRPPSRIFNESDWSDLSMPMGAYEKSKTLAEKAAWNLIKNLPNDKKMQLVTIAPGLVLGPSLTASQSTSSEIVGKLMRKEIPGCPKIDLALTDVRDVAKAHLAAMTSNTAAGKRYIVAGPSTPMIEVAKILEQAYAKRGYRIPTRSLPSFLVRLVALFDKSVGLIKHELDKPMHISSERAKQELGYAPRSTQEMVLATADSLIEFGVV